MALVLADPDAPITEPIDPVPTYPPAAEPIEPTPARSTRRAREAPSVEEASTIHQAPRRHKVVSHAVMVLLAVFTIFPIVWMYVESFRPQSDIFSTGLFSLSLSPANYRQALDSVPVWTLFWHTVVIALCVSAGQLLTSLLAAYGFCRYEFRGKSLIFYLFIGSWLVPFQVTMLPNYVLLSHYGLLNTLAGVIVPQLASAFAILLLRQHLGGFPTELLDAARVEGQGSWKTLWTVVVPNLTATLAALAILLFVSSWNEYFWPLLVFRNPNSVIQLGIQNFLDQTSINFGALMAMAGLATLPIFIIYAVLQRKVVSAFVRSGLK